MESIKITFKANLQPTYMQSPMQKIEANTATDTQAPLLSVCIRLIIWIEIIRIHRAWWYIGGILDALWNFLLYVTTEQVMRVVAMVRQSNEAANIGFPIVRGIRPMFGLSEN